MKDIEKKILEDLGEEEFDKAVQKKQLETGIKRIKELIPVGSRVAFYPSSGTHVEAFDFSKLPLDFVICCDYDVGEKQLGKIITFKGDNNLCLRILIESGIKLDAIFAVQDGAIDGGNHEYVNSVGFLGRALLAVNNTFVLVSNISNYFAFERGPIKLIPFDGIEIYRQAIYSTYDTHVDHYEIRHFEKMDCASHIIQIGQHKTIQLFRKSIWQDQNELDALFKGLKDRGTGERREALAGYWPSEYMEDKLFDIFEFTPEGSILPLLEFANRKGFAKIGLVPFAAGPYRNRGYNRIVRNGYQQFVEDFRNWGHEYPKQINLYHFDKDDFGELYRL